MIQSIISETTLDVICLPEPSFCCRHQEKETAMWKQQSHRIAKWYWRRAFSEWNQRGHDITFESLTFGDRPKVMLQAYAPTGFDVFNCVKKVDEKEEAESGTMHFNGSISK